MCSHSSSSDPIKHSCSKSCYRELPPTHTQLEASRGDFCPPWAAMGLNGAARKSQFQFSFLIPTPRFQDYLTKCQIDRGLLSTQQSSRTLLGTPVTQSAWKGKPQPDL